MRRILIDVDLSILSHVTGKNATTSNLQTIVQQQHKAHSYVSLPGAC